jgi:metal-dependent amidase/aminoacylase/carboxypeptidase family protein
VTAMFPAELGDGAPEVVQSGCCIGAARRSGAGRYDRLALRHRHVCRRHSWEVTLFGRGAPGSRPQKSIDPVVMAASAVVTVSTLRAGMTENVIPDQALLRLNVRTFKDHVRQRVPAAIRRILEADATASARPEAAGVLGAERVSRDQQRPGRNPRCSKRFRTLVRHGSRTRDQPAAASEDFGIFGAAFGVPSVIWFVGGVGQEIFAAAEKAGTVDALPGNHAPDFAPANHPTLRTGVEA